MAPLLTYRSVQRRGSTPLYAKARIKESHLSYYMWYYNVKCMDAKSYIHCRDACWVFLIKHRVCALPVNPFVLCEAEDILLIPYSQARRLIAILGLENACAATDGLAIQYNQERIILYNDAMPPTRQRYTIAHEMAHYVLGHVGGQRQSAGHTPAIDVATQVERQANYFAIGLLAPACVLWGMNLLTAEDIARHCHISKEAAAIRAERISILTLRHQRLKMHYGRGCFLSSALERQVYRQFRPYVEMNRL